MLVVTFNYVYHFKAFSICIETIKQLKFIRNMLVSLVQFDERAVMFSYVRVLGWNS